MADHPACRTCWAWEPPALTDMGRCIEHRHAASPSYGCPDHREASNLLQALRLFRAAALRAYAIEMERRTAVRERRHG